MKKTLVLSVALALAGLSNVALAAEGGAGFVRAEIGRSDVDVDTAFGSASDDDTAYSIRGGYFFNANIGVEGFYSNLYDQDDVEISALGVGVVAKKNFGADGNGFFINGRAGVARMRGEVLGDSDNSTKPYVGAGVGYDFSESFGLSLNYDLHRADFEGVDVDADTLTLAGEWRF